MSVPPKLIQRFNIIPVRISERFFEDINKNTLKFIMKGQGTRIAKTISEKNNVGRNSLIKKKKRNSLINFKTLYNK